MGAAAYNRGSALISRQQCAASGCRGCSACSEYKPTPRPASWGEKTYAKALKKGLGVLRYMRARGRTEVSASELADMIQYDTRFGRETAELAALVALEESCER